MLEIALVPTGKIIDDTDLEIPQQQEIDHVTSDEPCPAGDDGDRLCRHAAASRFSRITLK